jgi:two-component system, chemotaxis family, protein-glutamate methylesterase/glutaminase
MTDSTPVRRSTGRSGDPNGVPPVGYRIVVVGTSWGGLDALRTVVASLPAEFDLPIAIVQHRHRDSDALLARFLQGYTRLHVCEVEDKQPIEPGKLFIAPANYHMLVELGHFSLSVEAPVRYSRPSIDVAMISAASAYRHETVGVVLTGANADGSEGLRRIHDAGGMAVIQHPATAEVAAMPAAAIERVPTARVFPLDRIGNFLGELPSQHERTRSA